MRTLGLIGGMSPESTQPYYRIINASVRAALGGLHSARLILYSVDFQEIETCQRQGDWPAAGRLLAQAAQALQAAGAELLVLCTNTMHKVAPEIEAATRIPLLHIADATAAEILRGGLDRVGLIGTRFTMEQAFYRERLARHGISTLIPPERERNTVHRIIFEELCLGQTLASSRERYRRILHQLADAGAQAIILGCTEISLLVDASDSPVPLFDTTALHAEAAAREALRPVD